MNSRWYAIADLTAACGFLARVRPASTTRGTSWSSVNGPRSRISSRTVSAIVGPRLGMSTHLHAVSVTESTSLRIVGPPAHVRRSTADGDGRQVAGRRIAAVVPQGAGSMVTVLDSYEDRPMTAPIADRHTGVARSGGSRLAAWVIGVGRGLWLLPLDIAFRTVGLRYGWLRALFGMAPPRLLASIGQLRAERAAWRAARAVPAYRFFLQEAGIDPGRPLPARDPAQAPRDGQAELRGPLRHAGALRGRHGPLRRHDHRRVQRLDGHALRLDPRLPRADGRPPQHRVLRPLRVRDRAPRHDQRLLDGRLGRRLQHEPRDDAPRHRQVHGPGSRQDPLDAPAPGPRLPVPHLGLSPVPQASPRRRRRARLPLERVPDARPGRRRGHDRGAAGPAAHAVRLRLLRVRRHGHRDRHGRRVAGQRRAPAPRPGAAGHPRRAVRGRPAPPDGVPVQPAHPLHGGERRARARVHREPARPPVAAHALQRPRPGRAGRVRPRQGGPGPARLRPRSAG